MSASSSPTRRQVFALLAIVAVAAAASLPATFGTWVYDDARMRGNPAMSDLADIPAVWTRHSSDYLEGIGNQLGIRLNGATYRPFTMLTLVSVHVLAGESALAHHLVSLALHACCVALLWSLRRRQGSVRSVDVLALLVFALHPAFGEAWLWINGRSDLVAGVALAALAWSATFSSTWKRLAAVFCASVLGMFSKETFLLAALTWSVWWFLSRRELVTSADDAPSFGGTARRALLPFVAVVGAAFVLYWAARQTVIGSVSGARSLGTALPLELVTQRLPGIAALTAERLVFPYPSAMRNLAYELFAGFTPIRGLAVLLVVAFVVFAALRRRWSLVVLVIGAVATVAPTMFVADLLWYGFDRYLYMVGVLGTIAVVCDPSLTIDLSKSRTRVVVGAIAFALAAGTFSTALRYTSQAALVEAMYEDRPDDPAGYIERATQAMNRGRGDEARAWVGRIPLASASPAALLKLAEIMDRLGYPAESEQLVRRAAALAPSAIHPKINLLSLLGAQRRYREALPLARALLADDRTCTATTQMLTTFKTSRDAPADRTAIDRLIATSPCRDLVVQLRRPSVTRPGR